MLKHFTLLLIALLFTACSGDRKASELLETAQFEETQHNLDHARQLYQDIVKKYPGTAAAKSANSRLVELSKH